MTQVTHALERTLPTLTRLRVAVLLVGCALLFWQYDGAPGDWLFGIAILASVLLWWRRRPGLDLAWPQILVLGFGAATGLATIAARGSLSSFLITAYLIALSLTIASVLREDRGRLRLFETGLIFSGALCALLICIGYVSRQMGWQPLEILSYDAFRGEGLFKDPNPAGAFVACTYPFAVARAARRDRWPALFVLLATAVFGAGVIFTFSREALLLFGLAVVVTTILFGLLRQRRTVAALLLFSAVGVIAFGTLNRLPAYRGYQLLASYDQNGRFVAWRFAVDMLRAAPLGTGAGSFEGRSQGYFDAALGLNLAPAPFDAASGAMTPPVEPAAGFHSSVVSQPAVIRLQPGAISDPVTFVFRNTGSHPWTRGVAGQEAELGVGEAGLQLEAVTGPPIAQLSHFEDLGVASLDAGWPDPERLAIQTEQSVSPGSDASFTFQIRAPREPGTYRLHIRPMVSGVTWMEDEGLALEITITAKATSSSATASVASAAAPAGSGILAPVAPSPYEVPTGAVRVSTSAQLIAALAGPTRDIVLANGVYDNPEPFYDPSGHRLYAATLGGAVLHAGLSLGANDGSGGGLIQGVAFDVSDPAKTLANSIVRVWGAGGVGSQVLDVTINGHKAIGAGIAVLPPESVAIQRVVVRDVTDDGVIVLPAGDSVSGPIDLADLDISGVARSAPGSSNGTSEACVWFGNTATLRRALIRSCGIFGVWIGAGNTGSVLEHVDIDGASIGAYLDETVSQLTIRYARTGALVGTGLVAADLAGRQPTPTADASSLVVVPSAHNTYLRVAAESGALGFITFGAYLILVFWSLLTRAWRQNWAICLGMGLALLAGFGIDTLHWRELWIYVGIAAAVGQRNPAPIAPPAVAVTLWMNRQLALNRLEGVFQAVWAALRPARSRVGRTIRAVATGTAGVLAATLAWLLRQSSLAAGTLTHWVRERPAVAAPTAVEPPDVDASAIAYLESISARRPEPEPAAGDVVGIDPAGATASEDLRRAEIRLAAKQETLGFGHPDVADELHLIGSIHHDAGRYTDAIAFYSMALSIHERAVGENHPVVASILEDLAAARREDGDDHEADRLLARATAIKEEWHRTVFLTAQAEAFEREPAANPPIGEPPAPDRGIGTRPPHGPSTRSTHRTRTRGPK